MRRMKELRGLAIVDVSQGRRIGRADEVLISPSSGRLLGFVMKGIGVLRRRERVVEMADVRSIGPDAITVDDAAVAHSLRSAPDDLRAARRGDRVLIGKRVVTQAGRVVGTVSDCMINEGRARVSGLLLGSGLFGRGDMVSADRILSIGPDAIVLAEGGRPADPSQRPFAA